MKTLKTALTAIPFAALCASYAPDAAAYTYYYGGFGCSGPAYISGHRALTPHCAGGATVSLQSGAQADIAESAWRQWWHMNTANPAVWIDRWAGTCTNNGLNTGDGVNQAWLHGNSFNAGQTVFTWNCGFFGAPDIQAMDIEVFTGNLDGQSSCRSPTFTEDGTWVHEIGHDYGYAHFDDFLSTMNTSTPDVTSCRADRRVRPSSDAQQGHAARYGLPSAWDVGGSPMIQTGALTGGGVSIPGSTIYIAPGTTTVTANVQFTSMNMRGAWPSATIPVTLWLSSDNFVNGGDNRLVDTGLWETFAGAIYPYTVGVSFNASAIPVGTQKCVLVHWDANGTTSEYDESDNVTDTNFCFYRL
jgi:hypothetical protein